jgi:glycosyltransferase involved in cell wall biosynthesis
MEKTFTIITATILRPSLVETCRSIETQAYDRWQHLIAIDVPLSDATPEQLQLVDQIRHPKRQVFQCEVSHRNYGNTCKSEMFRHVCGDYVLYLDDDDVYLGEVFQILNREISDETWGVFPIERFGELFLNLPPRINLTSGTQFFYKPLYPFPNTDAYAADGELIEFLREKHSYLVVNSPPLVRVAKQNFGVA